MNLLFDILKHHNSSFGEAGSKSVDDDFEWLRKNMTERKINIDGDRLKKLLHEFSNFYFRNFVVFKYALSNPSKPSRHITNMVVDRPMWVPPLAQATQMPI